MKYPGSYISYIKDLELAKKKAEEADKLKSAFLANMSHEIRTPMNAILGFTHLLANDDTLAVEIRKEYIGIIQSSGNYLMKLIEDIIDLAKIEAGELKITEEPVNIDVIFKELNSIFLKNIEAKLKPIELNYYNDLDYDQLVFLCDNHRLKQVLINLLGNAVKFTNNGSIEFGYAVFGDFVQFYVKDTGIGIPKDMREKIFDRFCQIDNVRYDGAGLGLAITKSLVNKLGGHIWFISEAGRGSTFYFTIPYKKIIVNEDVTLNEIEHEHSN